MSDRNLSDLSRALQPIANQWLSACAAHNIPVIITETWRTPQEQDAIYASGRTTGGAILTHTTSADSKHCCTINGMPASKAFDFMIKDGTGHLIIDGKHPLYGYCGALGVALGLTWGGNWPHPDYDHLEMA